MKVINEKIQKLINLLLNGDYYPTCNYSDEKGQLVIDLEDYQGNCIGGLVLNNLSEEELRFFQEEKATCLWYS